MELLLLSNSTDPKMGYLGHCVDEVTAFFSGVKDVTFIPYALKDWDTYTHNTRERFQAMGKNLTSIHEYEDAASAVKNSEAFYVGGGNTFRLLKILYDMNLLPLIRDNVLAGGKYMGASAGTNIACKNVRTTNDMPIVYPPSLDALNLFPLNINPHYLDGVEKADHQGETREKRLLEFLEENTGPVLAIREGAMVRVSNKEVLLKGKNGGRLFITRDEIRELNDEEDLSFLLD
ncbi:MAG: dipeptidase PepE [Acidobacteriota bacterium]|nr:dipeptidase PepE [Acidobacteriota bacterium]